MVHERLAADRVERLEAVRQPELLGVKNALLDFHEWHPQALRRRTMTELFRLYGEQPPLSGFAEGLNSSRRGQSMLIVRIARNLLRSDTPRLRRSMSPKQVDDGKALLL